MLYTLKAALRDKIILSFALMFLVVISLSFIMGDAAVIEKDQFALIFMAGFLRFVCVTGLILFIVFFIRRCHEARDIEFILSRPVSKMQLILSYLIAFFTLAFFASLACWFCLAGLSAGENILGYTIWALSLLLELCIISSTAFFFSMSLSSAVVAAFASFAFYALARMMGQLLGIIDHNATSGIFTQSMEWIMQIISALTPRLDLLAQSEWLLYGLQENTSYLVPMISACIYILLLYVATYMDLLRKQF
jgi:hypothetical protein